MQVDENLKIINVLLPNTGVRLDGLDNHLLTINTIWGIIWRENGRNERTALKQQNFRR